MSNQLNAELLAQMYGQVSDDPFVMLVTISHAEFPTIYLVNNTQNVVSRGITHIAFPMSFILPEDNGETSREMTMEFDNVSLELIDELRTVTTPMDFKVEMVLASSPNIVQMSIEEMKLRSVSYDKQKVSARLYMDSFLNVEMTSEKYTPTNYKGLF